MVNHENHVVERSGVSICIPGNCPARVGGAHHGGIMRRFSRHGHSPRKGKTPTYTTWSKVIARCTNPCDRRYADYGGRGITVCEEWKTFMGFLADMGDRPKGMTLDRRDNSKGYEPSNCRWATPKEQQRNTRSNRLISFNGATKCVTEWAETLGIGKGTLNSRLQRGWTEAEALSTPTIPNGLRPLGRRNLCA
jgi:hypothetical protein